MTKTKVNQEINSILLKNKKNDKIKYFNYCSNFISSCWNN